MAARSNIQVDLVKDVPDDAVWQADAVLTDIVSKAFWPLVHVVRQIQRAVN